ncbi:MAG: SDR family oxidoreductase [Euryarchaeota archaeon]|nr:SDR family oxidoreductase [Euryarchaeota archaeon]NDB93397.1 SDR family oxidoreductase [Euryarchaeota archaeon]NDF37068.1 SDR family oxidoreductase [Euryarchaeota archaeon]NDG21926.1 SDR family oxidoreductase [Euryarchaeota archaeon]
MDGAVIVTGGSRRIGKKISQLLSSAGFPVIIHYNSSSSEAEELASELRSRGGMAETLMCDLSSTSDLEDMIERADAIFNVGIAGLVNNASMYSYDDVDSIDHRSFSSHMSVNAYAPLTLSTQMHKRGRGWVVNILDFKVESPNSDFLSYTISKFALASITDILARELAPVLRVNAVAPGHTLTSDYLDEGKLESTNSSTPLGLGPAPDDIADAVLYLAKAKSVTGQTIFVDGGERFRQQPRDPAFSGDRE